MRTRTATLLVIAACSEVLVDDPDLGTATISISQVPADVSCFAVTVAGTRTVEKQFNLTPGATSTVFALKGLPVGLVTVNAGAYAETCATLVPASVALWVSDPVEVTLVAGATPSIALTMRRNGQLDVSVDFEDDLPPSGTIAEFAVSSQAYGLTRGADGALWFTEPNANMVGRITTAGVVTEWLVPTPNSTPWGIAAGSDGNVWFCEWGASKIGRISPSGQFLEFGIPTGGTCAEMTLGPDGNIWFTQASDFGRITPNGVVTHFDHGGYVLQGMTSMGGKVWATALGFPQVIEIAMDGSIPTHYNPPHPGNMLTVGPDGNVWIAGANGSNNVLKMSASGLGTILGDFPLSTPSGAPFGIAAGPDGNVWVTMLQASRIARLTVEGGVVEYALPASNAAPYQIVAGPDGNLWFTEWIGRIGRISP